jgi:alkyl sulfatase BDS1-like metallo-beta-lactamase superfamily hydrolase
MKALTVSIDAEKAEGETLVLNIRFIKLNRNFVLTLRNSVMYYREGPMDESAEVSINLSHEMLVNILIGAVDITDLLTSNDLSIDGSRLRLVKFFSLLSSSDGDFNIVLP